MPTKPLRVKLEPVFVRDHQRRLRLVMDLLEQELHQPARQAEQKKPITISDRSETSSRLPAQIGGHAV